LHKKVEECILNLNYRWLRKVVKRLEKDPRRNLMTPFIVF
jgi:hypothetical protein